jgi:hypothetical protein
MKKDPNAQCGQKLHELARAHQTRVALNSRDARLVETDELTELRLGQVACLAEGTQVRRKLRRRL